MRTMRILGNSEFIFPIAKPYITFFSVFISSQFLYFIYQYNLKLNAENTSWR